MLIKQILQTAFTNDDAIKYQASVKKQLKQLHCVTKLPITRGDVTIEINHIQYKVNEFDQSVNGLITELFQTNDHLLLLAYGNDYDVLTPCEPISDHNTLQFIFQPKQQKGQTMSKFHTVVGTTFHDHYRYTDFEGTMLPEHKTLTKLGTAVLLPEPENPYDKKAVAVIAKMIDGKPFKLGYLKKGSDLQAQITSPTVAKLMIIAYSETGDLNDSYLVEVE